MRTRVWALEVNGRGLPAIETRSLDQVVLLARSHALALIPTRPQPMMQTRLSWVADAEVSASVEASLWQELFIVGAAILMVRT